jgi:hypothetical protein
MDCWRVFLKGRELHMIHVAQASPKRLECLQIEVHGMPTQLLFTGLSNDARYVIFVDLAIGNLTGRITWAKVKEGEYAFHLDNW